MGKLYCGASDCSVFYDKKSINFEQQLERLSFIAIRLHADVRAEFKFLL